MQFVPYVWNHAKDMIPVSIEKMTLEDAVRTDGEPHWQTSWNSDFLNDPRLERYSAKVDDELIALVAYEIMDDELITYIVYMEAHPESNPTLDGGKPKYSGIG